MIKWIAFRGKWFFSVCLFSFLSNPFYFSSFSFGGFWCDFEFSSRNWWNILLSFSNTLWLKRKIEICLWSKGLMNTKSKTKYCTRSIRAYLWIKMNRKMNDAWMCDYCPLLSVNRIRAKCWIKFIFVRNFKILADAPTLDGNDEDLKETIRGNYINGNYMRGNYTRGNYTSTYITWGISIFLRRCTNKHSAHWALDFHLFITHFALNSLMILRL